MPSKGTVIFINSVFSYHYLENLAPTILVPIYWASEYGDFFFTNFFVVFLLYLLQGRALFLLSTIYLVVANQEWDPGTCDVGNKKKSFRAEFFYQVIKKL